MKILNVIANIDPRTGGGTAERTLQMARALNKRGTTSSILALDLGQVRDQKLKFPNVNFHTFPCLWKRFFIPVASLKKIEVIVKDADLVHLMGHWTILNAMVYLAIRKFKKNYVFCPAGALPIFGRSKILKKIYNLIIGKKIALNARVCIAITEDEISHFSSYGVDRNLIVVISNGIDASEYLSRLKNDEETGLLKNMPFTEFDKEDFILYLGRLNLIKGPDLLLDAFIKLREKYNNLHLVYAGPDEGLLTKLTRTVREHDLLGRVHFIGYISGERKNYLLSMAKILIIPSRSEAMSIVFLEAGILGTPVLATQTCGINIVESIQGGKIVPPDSDQIAMGIQSLLAEPDQLPYMGMRLRKYVIENYTWETISERLFVLYNEILS